MNLQEDYQHGSGVHLCIHRRSFRPSHGRGQAASDKAVTNEVRQALGSQGGNVSVRTVDGTVFLRGRVTYAEDANDMEWKARRTPGVQSVNADIDYDYTVNQGGQ